VALALVAQARPDLLVTDQHMPRLGGVTLITRLQAATVLDIPAIFVSASAPPTLPPHTTPGPSGVPEAQLPGWPAAEALVARASGHPDHSARGHAGRTRQMAVA